MNTHKLTEDIIVLGVLELDLIGGDATDISRPGLDIMAMPDDTVFGDISSKRKLMERSIPRELRYSFLTISERIRRYNCVIDINDFTCIPVKIYDVDDAWQYGVYAVFYVEGELKRVLMYPDELDHIHTSQMIPRTVQKEGSEVLMRFRHQLTSLAEVSDVFCKNST